MDYPLLCASFWDYNVSVAHNHDVLPQTNRKNAIKFRATLLKMNRGPHAKNLS